MPILHHHLAEGLHSDAAIGELLVATSRLYAEVLQCPIERVRVFAHVLPARHVAVGGRLVSEGQAGAPFFEFMVLEGRPVEQCQDLLARITELIVATLGVDRSLVRGVCKPVPPALWAIAGQPASAVRAAEIQSRAP